MRIPGGNTPPGQTVAMRTRIAVVAALLVVATAGAPVAAAVALPAQTPTTTPTTAPTPTTTPTTPPTTPSTTPSTAATTTPPTTSQPTSTTPTTRETTTSSSTSSTTSTTTPATATRGGSGLSGKTIALIILAVVAALLIILLIVVVLRRQRREQWAREARDAVADGTGLAGVVSQGLAALDQPVLAARTWSDLDSRGARLHGRLGVLAERAPDERSGAVVTGMDRDLQALRSAVEADRALRVGPPAPTAEQLGYSAAVVRQRLADLQQSLGQLDNHLRQFR